MLSYKVVKIYRWRISTHTTLRSNENLKSTYTLDSQLSLTGCRIFYTRVIAKVDCGPLRSTDTVDIVNVNIIDKLGSRADEQRVTNVGRDLWRRCGVSQVQHPPLSHDFPHPTTSRDMQE